MDLGLTGLGLSLCPWLRELLTSQLRLLNGQQLSLLLCSERRRRLLKLSQGCVCLSLGSCCPPLSLLLEPVENGLLLADKLLLMCHQLLRAEIHARRARRVGGGHGRLSLGLCRGT